MKKTRILSFMASAVATVALLTGCSTENDLENGKEGLASLELSSVSSSDMLTRAVIDGTIFPKDGHIGLFLFKDESAVSPYGDTGCSNVEYSYNGDNGKWTANPPITVDGEPGYLYGYYPYSSSVTDIKSIPVASSLDGDDVMYATKQTVTDETASQTAIKMNHALARVTITVVNNGYTLGEGELSSIKFSGAEASVSGILDATSGIISGTTKADVTLEVPSGKQSITAEGTVYECLLVPSEEESLVQTLDLTLNIDGNDKTTNLSGDTGITIARNTKSNLTIALSNTGISVQTVSIEDWNVVEVGGHKVTVKVADDIAAGDIMFSPYVDGNNVIIRAISFQGKRLVCDVGDNANCERTVIDGKFTFTISEISSDIDAVLGYAPTYALTVTSDSNGKVWIGDDETKTSGQFEAGQQVVIHATANENFRLFRWNDNNRETSRTITIGETDAIYSALFISADAIPGLYTVNSEDKQVFFSKGNLWCDGTGTNYSNASPKIKSWGFESNQYDSTPSISAYRSISHISHFWWCADESNAVCEKYNNDWSVNGVFLFTNADATTPNPNFAVNGKQGYWRVLSGGKGGEWEYLLDKRKTTYGTGELSENNRRYAEVKVNNIAGLLIFPDDFSSWPSGAGNEPQTFNTNSSNWNDKNYSDTEFIVLQDNGCVFLPAAGYRNGDSSYDRPAKVYGVGFDGYYWSASPYGNEDAYNLYFYSGNVYPTRSGNRFQACSVRLVTEVK